MNHIIDEYAGVIIGLIVSYSMINIFGNIFTGVNMKDVINTYGEAVIGMCAVVVAMTMIGMSMSAYRNILLGVIGSCLG